MYYGRPYYGPPPMYGPRYGYGYGYYPPPVVYGPPPPRYGGSRIVYRRGCNIF